MFGAKRVVAVIAAATSVAMAAIIPAPPAAADFLTGDGSRVGYRSWSADKCMDIQGGRTDNNAPMTIWDCYNTWNERLFVEAVGYDNVRREPIVIIETEVAANSPSW